jgi:hypothetical protein
MPVAARAVVTRTRAVLLSLAVTLCASIMMTGCAKGKETPQAGKLQDSALRKQKAGD